GTLVGLAATLRHGHADTGGKPPPGPLPGPPPTPTDGFMQDPPRSSDSGREGDDVRTQQTYPQVICPVHMKPSASKGSVEEIPINWEGSDLNLDQREVLRKLLLQFDIFVTTSKAQGEQIWSSVM
ncbi:hypothetical protein AaE_014046, partial [Aphanomyces astaci]